MTPILGIIASSTTASRLGDFESIATATVGAGGSSFVEFTSISGSYQHLQVRYIAKNTAASQDAYIQLDSADSVRRHQLYGDGATAYGTANSGIAYILFCSGSSGTNMFGVGVVDILDYANTNKTKTVRCLSGYDLNGSGNVGIGSALFTSTSAVTSIKIVSAGTNFAQYSHFALYGIKG